MTSAPPRLGGVLGSRFELEERAGKGGMGEVFRARDLATGERVAVKLLHWEGEEHEARFLREAQLLSRLSHPGIVRYVAHGSAPNAYLAMEWLEGEDLGRRLSRAALTLRESLELGCRIAEALAAAHRRGVVHRDIKPNNVFLVDREPSRVKLLDFGIARQIQATRAVTMTGQVVGTIGYMAPEQAGEGREIDASVDVFSLGCVLFECLAGRAPFTGDRLVDVLAKILLAEPPRVSDLRDDVPPQLDSLVLRMMQKSPGMRPTIPAIVAELEAVAAQPRLSELRPRTHRPSDEAGPAVSADEQRLLSVVLASVDLRGRETNPKVQPSAVPRAAGVRELGFAVEGFGGRLEVLANGHPLAVLSGSGVATDLAARAAQCALAMRAILPSARLSVAMGRGDPASATSVGDVVARAARMLELGAEGKGIRVDHTTAGLLDARFELSGDAEGLSLVAARARGEPVRRLLGRATPFEGRERELAQVRGSIEEAFSEPIATAIVITAPPGTGKSRLAHELVSGLEASGARVAVWSARGDPLAAGSSFGILGQIVRGLAGLLDGERPEVWHQKLHARVARHVPAHDALRVAELLGEIVGARFPDEGRPMLRAARADAALLGEQMRSAWETFVGAECAHEPVLVVIEDLHWGDLPSVRFFDAALRTLRARPLVVLALARPEVQETFPRLWEERRVQHVRLAELTQRAARRLVVEVLGTGVDERTVSALVERAAGNAFYLEELIRAVAEGRGDTLPDTVLAMAQARLERLSPDERRLLRAASVFGHSFWVGGVAALLGAEAGDAQRDALSAAFDELANRELVVRHEASRFRDEEELSFRHLLVRDAAYGMLTPRDAKLAHQRAAAWLEAVGERNAIVMAEHLERGGEPQGAVVWYLWAAEQAFEGHDLAAVVARAERGVLCGASGAVLGELRLLQAEALGWGAHAEDHAARAREALSLAPAGSGAEARAAAELAVAGSRSGDHVLLELAAQRLADGMCPRERGAPDEVAAGALALAETRVRDASSPPVFAAPATSAAHSLAVARTVIELSVAGRPDLATPLVLALESAVALDPEDAIQLALVRRWLVLVRALFAGRPEPYVLGGEPLFAELEAAGQLRHAVIAGVQLAIACGAVGDDARAVAWAERMIARADGLALRAYAERARAHSIAPLARTGAVERAEALANRCIAQAVATGDRVTEARARVSLVMLRVERLEGEDAELVALEARAVRDDERYPSGLRAEASEALAALALRVGRPAQALLEAERGIVLAERGSVRGAIALRVAMARALELLGDRAGARAAWARAADELSERAQQMTDAATRALFLAVPAHTAALDAVRSG